MTIKYWNEYILKRGLLEWFKLLGLGSLIMTITVDNPQIWMPQYFQPDAEYQEDSWGVTGFYSMLEVTETEF